MPRRQIGDIQHRATWLQHRPRRVVDEQLAVPKVPAYHRVAGVPGLRPDVQRRDPRLNGASGEAGAQAVARKACRVDTDGGDALLDDKRYGLPR
jgi:hypothetical protein